MITNEEGTQPKAIPFPTHAMPFELAEFIREANSKLSFPEPFTASAILGASSALIGNKYKIVCPAGKWKDSAMLWIVLAGRAGSIKTHPLKYVFRIPEQMNNERFAEYKAQLKDYHKWLNLTKTERKELNLPEFIPKPIREAVIVNDSTKEGLAEILKYNPKGICLYSDELASWFDNLSRYSKGNDEPFWLSTWSNQDVVIDRVSKESTNIEKSYISVIGTTQIGILKKLSGGERGVSGFFDRFLFSVIPEMKKNKWEENEQPDDSELRKCLTKLYQLPFVVDSFERLQPKEVQFSKEAWKVIRDFQHKNADEITGCGDDTKASVLSKMDNHVLRIVLNLHLIKYALSEDVRELEIEEETASSAIEIANYYKNNSLQILENFLNFDPLQGLTELEQNVFNALPDEFRKAEGTTVADAKGMKERTFHNFLRRNPKIIKKQSHGIYSKLC